MSEWKELTQLQKLVSKGIKITDFIEPLTYCMCKNYCKYPDKYSADENDDNWDKMADEICKNCPLQIF